MDERGLSERFQLRLAEELAVIRGIGRGTDRAVVVLERATRVFEALVSELWREFEDERSQLSEELAIARLSRDAFEQQLIHAIDLSAVAQRTGKPRWVRTAAAMLAPLLGAIALGAAEGAVSAYAGDAVRPTRAGQYEKACTYFIDEVERAEAGNQKGQDTDELLDQIDALIEDNIEFTARYIPKGHE